MVWRLQLLQQHPEVIPELVPWAAPPFYGGADDQPQLNDALISAVVGRSEFIATARWEARAGGPAGLGRRARGPRLRTSSRPEFRALHALSRAREDDAKSRAERARTWPPAAWGCAHAGPQHFAWRLRGGAELIQIAPDWLIRGGGNWLRRGGGRPPRCSAVTHSPRCAARRSASTI